MRRRTFVGLLAASAALGFRGARADMPLFRTDVVVIGAGCAGLSAAIEARTAGARVLVLEKMPLPGGNSLMASGHLSGVGSARQRRLGLSASPGAFLNDVLKCGGAEVKPELASKMVRESGEAVDWLEALGADLSVVEEVPGTGERRLFRPQSSDAVGAEIVNALMRRIETLQVPVQTFARAVSLRFEDGVFTGVVSETRGGERTFVEARSVVIAAGGYAGGAEVVQTFSPGQAGMVSSNTAGATGDGIRLGKGAGAAFTGLNAVQCHPTALPLSGTIVSDAVRTEGAILVNGRGERFVNELAPDDEVVEAILREGGSAWIIADRGIAKQSPSFARFIGSGAAVSARSAADLAARIGAPGLAETLARYRRDAAAGKDSAWSRPSLASTLRNYPLYAIKVRPALHSTPGGIVINERAEVLNDRGEAIPGVYAAGEVTGGVHGVRRLEDAALCDAVVFGRTAGREAALFAEASGRKD